MTATISLRPVHAGDQAVLYHIYASTRLEELAPLGWNAMQQTAFLLQQFNAQQRSYQSAFAGADFQMVLLDSEVVGRLYVAQRPQEIRLIDIALLPKYRKAGIGSRLLGDLLAEAQAVLLPVRLHVEKHNPALRLYKRFGFRTIEDRGIYWFMERAPDLAIGHVPIHT